MNQEKHLLSVKDIEKRWGISKRTLYKKVARRELPAIKIGTRCYVLRSDWDAYLGKNRINPRNGGESI